MVNPHTPTASVLYPSTPALVSLVPTTPRPSFAWPSTPAPRSLTPRTPRPVARAFPNTPSPFAVLCPNTPGTAWRVEVYDATESAATFMYSTKNTNIVMAAETRAIGYAFTVGFLSFRGGLRGDKGAQLSAHHA